MRICENGLCSHKYGEWTPVDPEHVRMCEDWINRFAKIQSTYSDDSSYGLKHDVERFYGEYVTNGSFIQAALNMGYKVKKNGGGVNNPNACFNMSVTRPEDQFRLVNPTGFSKWLFSRENMDLPYAHLAIDAKEDSNWPRQGKDYLEFYEVVRRYPYAVEQLSEAWLDYTGKSPAIGK